uniref:3'-5' exonuclease n=1 Tax=Candidatus Desulfatibia profunda TaxID=2841695 RepID=A0A8J6NN38_9BACT|nr:3'-5' exonuclease [Candidatus Desulfatibia profunda]
MRPLGVATLSQLKYVVFDIETTGLSAKNDRIIQIAAVKIDGDKIPVSLKNKIKDTDPSVPTRKDTQIYNAFINPKRNIPSKITSLTGIKDSMVKNQPGEESILEEFFGFIGDRILVAHNGIRFDVRFIEEATKRVGMNIENFLCLDTLWLSKKLYPAERSHSLNAIIDRFQLKLSYGDEFLSQRHNALVDVMLTAEALRLFMAELKNQNKDKLLLV